MRVKDHQVQFQNHHLSAITNLCLHFYLIKHTWAFKQQPVLKCYFLILEATAPIIKMYVLQGSKVTRCMCGQVPIFLSTLCNFRIYSFNWKLTVKYLKCHF